MNKQTAARAKKLYEEILKKEYVLDSLKKTKEFTTINFVGEDGNERNYTRTIGYQSHREEINSIIAFTQQVFERSVKELTNELDQL